MLCLLLVGEKKKGKRSEMAKGLSPRAGHALLDVQHRIFAALRCN
jgi:hypothetical protein